MVIESTILWVSGDKLQIHKSTGERVVMTDGGLFGFHLVLTPVIHLVMGEILEVNV